MATGGNRGIGFETCRQLAEGIVLNGFELVLLEKHKHNGNDECRQQEDTDEQKNILDYITEQYMAD